MLLKINNLDDAIAEEIKEITGFGTASKAAQFVLNHYPRDCLEFKRLEAKHDKLNYQYNALKQELNDLKTALRYVRDAIE